MVTNLSTLDFMHAIAVAPRDFNALLPHFVIDGHDIENVITWPHLGHILNASMSDDDDILARRNIFVGQTITFVCNFSKVDVSVRKIVFKSYCSSHYGAELWDLANLK